jgi:hypothetical protein
MSMMLAARSALQRTRAEGMRRRERGVLRGSYYMCVIMRYAMLARVRKLRLGRARPVVGRVVMAVAKPEE